jgi:DNA-binding NarL/FixJ family response regulator
VILVHDAQGSGRRRFYLARMTPQPPIRVLIADDHRLFAETLGLALDAHPRLHVVGYAGDGREAVKLALALDPDVVLMDLDMPLVDGLEATRVICASLPAQVAVLTASPLPEDSLRAREAGAAAYLTKGSSAEEVVDALLELGSAPAPSGLPSPAFPPRLLQFRARLAH